MRLQGAVVRAGHGASEVTVHSGDKFEAGIGGNSDSERAELLEARALVSKERTTYEYAFSMFFPETFPIVPTRLVIAQWKQYCPESRKCSDDSPVLAKPTDNVIIFRGIEFLDHTPSVAGPTSPYSGVETDPSP